ncbi:MAG: hypothetical protein ACI89L_000370 [Phycisphaerales bacterium]|jgi:hypothetical protein
MNARPRKALSVLITLIGLLGATAAMVLVNLLAATRPVRLDLTLAGEHRLSDRTQLLLDGLTGDFEMVLAVDSEAVPDPAAFVRVADTLTAIADAKPRVSFSLIDLASGESAAESAAVVQRLAERDADQIATREGLIQSSADRLDRVAAFLNTLADRLLAVRDAIPDEAPSAATNRGYFEQRAGLMRVASTDLSNVTRTARQELSHPTGPTAGPEGEPTPLTDTDRFLGPLMDVCGTMDAQFASLARDLRSFAQAPAIDAATRDAASPIPTMLAEQRDRLAILADELKRAEPLEALRIGTALETGEVLLVVGPPDAGAVAVPISALLTLTDVVDSMGLSSATWSAQRAEDLVASAIGSLVNPDPPIVVLTHGEPLVGVLDAPTLQGFIRRLSLRGVDVAEWAAAVNPEPPTLNDLDPDQLRPRVYVTLNPDSTAPALRGQPDQAGTQRAIRFAAALRTVIDRGKPVLLSANPSIFPTYGDTDPLTPIAEAFGMELGSATPILFEQVSPQGRRVMTDLALAGNESGHLIAEAAHGLAIFLPWAVPITAGDDATPLLTLSATGTWAEGEWLNLWQTDRSNRGALTNQPQPAGLRDLTSPEWTLAAAASRPNPETGRAQRFVLVGSNGWYLDPIANRQTEQNQQSVLTYPGNIELLEAAVFWLAGQDELISRSITAEQIATVRPLDASQLGALKWSLLLGLPALVLGLGVVFRLVFG